MKQLMVVWALFSLSLFQIAAVQVSPSQLAIENLATNYNQDLKTDIHIKGVFVTKVSPKN